MAGGISCYIILKWILLDLTVNIGWANGLVPLDNKPLPEPKLIQIYVAKWYHKATMS